MISWILLGVWKIESDKFLNFSFKEEEKVSELYFKEEEKVPSFTPCVISFVILSYCNTLSTTTTTRSEKLIILLSSLHRVLTFWHPISYAISCCKIMIFLFLSYSQIQLQTIFLLVLLRHYPKTRQTFTKKRCHA